MVPGLLADREHYQVRMGASNLAVSMPFSPYLFQGFWPERPDHTFFRQGSGYAVVRTHRPGADGYDLVSLPARSPEIEAILEGDKPEVPVPASRTIAAFRHDGELVEVMTVPNASYSGQMPRFLPPAGEVTAWQARLLVALVRQAQENGRAFRKRFPREWRNLVDQQSANYLAQARRGSYPLRLQGAPVFENAQRANVHRLLDIMLDRAPELLGTLGLPDTHEKLDAFLPAMKASDPYGPGSVFQLGDPSRGNTVITEANVVDALGAILTGGRLPEGLAEDAQRMLASWRQQLTTADLTVDLSAAGDLLPEFAELISGFFASLDGDLNAGTTPAPFSALPGGRGSAQDFLRNAAHVGGAGAAPLGDFPGVDVQGMMRGLLSGSNEAEWARMVTRLYLQGIDPDLAAIGGVHAVHDLRRLLHQLPQQQHAVLNAWHEDIGPVDQEDLEAARITQAFESLFIDLLRTTENDGNGWMRVPSEIAARSVLRVKRIMGIPPLNAAEEAEELARIQRDIDRYVDRNGLAVPVPPEPEQEPDLMTVPAHVSAEQSRRTAVHLFDTPLPGPEHLRATSVALAVEGTMKSNARPLAAALVQKQQELVPLRKEWQRTGRDLRKSEASGGARQPAAGGGAQGGRTNLHEIHNSARSKYLQNGVVVASAANHMTQLAIGRDAYKKQLRGKQVVSAAQANEDTLKIRLETILEGDTHGPVPSPPAGFKYRPRSAAPTHTVNVAAQGLSSVPLINKSRDASRKRPSAVTPNRINSTRNTALERDNVLGPFWER
ncbi:MAG: hypothetical protein HOV68_20225 [Streptomycetaceae bacterium]|nr:hypothetical protein [Streptomycetaceae bacterium]